MVTISSYIVSKFARFLRHSVDRLNKKQVCVLFFNICYWWFWLYCIETVGWAAGRAFCRLWKLMFISPLVHHAVGWV